MTKKEIEIRQKELLSEITTEEANIEEADEKDWDRNQRIESEDKLSKLYGEQDDLNNLYYKKQAEHSMIEEITKIVLKEQNKLIRSNNKLEHNKGMGMQELINFLGDIDERN